MNREELIDWEKIEEQYPKAHDKFNNWLDDKAIFCGQEFNNRLCYDFFDENDIMIEVTYFSEDGRFDASITKYGMNDGVYLFSTPYCKTRSEAEELAFLEAFKILEGKL